MKPPTRAMKLFVSTAVSTVTVLAMLFAATLMSCFAENRSPMQDWVFNLLPMLGIFLSVMMVLTILTGIPVLIEKLMKYNKH